MKYFYKKILLVVFVVAALFVTSAFRHLTFHDSEYSTYDFENTYADFDKGPGNFLDGELLLVGDSFAFLCGSQCGYELNYIVHQGYDIQHINIEFMEEIPYNKYKYCYLFIGPNDFMEQTNIQYFQRMLKEVINKLNNRGMRVVMSNYLDPDYNHEMCAPLRIAAVPCSIYDYLIKEIVLTSDCIYMDIMDLFQKYGRAPGDYVHPSKYMYRPQMDRLSTVIREDMKIQEAKKQNNEAQ